MASPASKGTCLSGLYLSAECEAKLWQLLECRTGHAPGLALTGDMQATLSLSCLPLCSLRKGLEKYSLGERPMSLHILFPLLTMVFQADFSLLSGRPLAPI